jgi:Tetracyclin repressor-like, C-terminal domain
LRRTGVRCNRAAGATIAACCRVRPICEKKTWYFSTQAGIATIHLPEFCAFRKDYWHHRLARIQVLFDRAIRRGELSPETDFQLLLETLIGVLYVRIFVVNEPVDEMLPERIVNLVLPGVGLGLSTE